MRELTRRRIPVPVYWMALILLTVAVTPVVAVVVSTKIARQNAAEQLDRYEADKVATAEANRGLYCVLFGSQMDAFADSQTPVGRASYEAWLAVYRLARCQPPRK